MKTKQFRIGRLATLGQVIKALGKTIRAMSNGTIDTADGARICHSLGILRTAFETQKLELLEDRLNKLSEQRSMRVIGQVPYTRISNNDETQRSPN